MGKGEKALPPPQPQQKQQRMAEGPLQVGATQRCTLQPAWPGCDRHGVGWDWKIMRATVLGHRVPQGAAEIQMLRQGKVGAREVWAAGQRSGQQQGNGGDPSGAQGHTETHC